MVKRKKLIQGSLSVSVDAHRFLTSLLSNDDPSLDSPFTTIIDAFRFAFALGYSKEIKKKSTGKAKTVSPRNFSVIDFTDILENEISKEFSSLGGLISAYAEAGVELMIDAVKSRRSLFSLLNDLS